MLSLRLEELVPSLPISLKPLIAGTPACPIIKRSNMTWQRIPEYLAQTRTFRTPEGILPRGNVLGFESVGKPDVDQICIRGPVSLYLDAGWINARL